MSDLLVSILIAVCPPSLDGGTNECHEQITNCAVELKTGITPQSIQKCVDEYMEGNNGEQREGISEEI